MYNEHILLSQENNKIKASVTRFCQMQSTLGGCTQEFESLQPFPPGLLASSLLPAWTPDHTTSF